MISFEFLVDFVSLESAFMSWPQCWPYNISLLTSVSNCSYALMDISRDYLLNLLSDGPL